MLHVNANPRAPETVSYGIVALFAMLGIVTSCWDPVGNHTEDNLDADRPARQSPNEFIAVDEHASQILPSVWLPTGSQRSKPRARR
jgi:hypothetical protein